ncbi:rhomboid family intramembrane serine protease [Benzoatithermus flavus]|uniref:Rhomboid family intramembrane serine protease n=1 Tax=Benzoatithermus flavus TaxID=3108223 RepID=A0ABU8XUZ5_9PROT
MTDLVEIGRFRRRADAEPLALVLAAVGVDYRLVGDGWGVSLLVAAPDVERARRELELYAHENVPAPKPRAEPSAAFHGLGAALFCCMILLFFHGADERRLLGIDWSAAGAAQAGLIRAGAWWRTVTALTLHADAVHLLGNLAAGIAFGLLATQLLGAGLAWLAILVGGALGNALDAFLSTPEHTAVGASTALFAALGILAGYWRRAGVVPWRGGVRRWAPLAAGVLLLVQLGTSGERTAVGAHVAGFGTGVTLGLLLAHHGSRIPRGPRAQAIYGAIACGLVVSAWLLALGHAG